MLAAVVIAAIPIVVGAIAIVGDSGNGATLLGHVGGPGASHPAVQRTGTCEQQQSDDEHGADSAMSRRAGASAKDHADMIGVLRFRVKDPGVFLTRP